MDNPTFYDIYFRPKTEEGRKMIEGNKSSKPPKNVPNFRYAKGLLTQITKTYENGNTPKAHELLIQLSIYSNKLALKMPTNQTFGEIAPLEYF